MPLFIGRQPILDRAQKTFGYELLFRGGMENVFENQDSDQASLSVIDTTFGHMGIQQITSGKKAFINFTRNLLLQDFALLLPSERLVIEMLETIEPDAEIISACQKLKGKGYMIALDDFQYCPEYEPLFQYADIIKVDISQVVEEDWPQYAEIFLPRKIQLLAERVETLDQFEQTKKLGFTYFQGFFFSQPVILEAEKPPASKIAKIQLLQEVNRPDFDINRAEVIIKHDPTLSWKLFRYINSAIFGFRHEIKSIRQALALLGEKNVRRWAIILILGSIAEDKPAELLRQAIVRARLCELLAEPAGLSQQDQELFMTGLFSHLDTMMNQPMDSLLADMQIDSEVKATLLGQATPYQDILSVTKSCECGDFDHLTKLLREHEIPEEKLPMLQQEAFTWADELAPV
jgi:c-di-GMP-related signal transduction protein